MCGYGFFFPASVHSRALQVFSVKEQGGSQAEGLCNGNFLLKATGVVG